VIVPVVRYLSVSVLDYPQFRVLKDKCSVISITC
jgi:hypothetical protein